MFCSAMLIYAGAAPAAATNKIGFKREFSLPVEKSGSSGKASRRLRRHLRK
jgi:hypothetical protein